MVKNKRAGREKSGPIGCLEAQKMIEPYLGGKLTDDELAAFIEHMGRCRDCYDELKVFHTVYSALGDDPGPYDLPLSLEEMISRSKAHLKRRRRRRSLSILAGAGAVFAALLVTAGLLLPDLPFSPRLVGEKLRALSGSGAQMQEELQTETETEYGPAEISTEASK